MSEFILRPTEAQAFTKMLMQELTQRILLIEARSGYGKTTLLRQFLEIAESIYSSTGIVSVSIDLRAARLGISYIFYRVRKVLERYDFPAYEMSEILDYSAIRNQMLIQVASQRESELLDREFQNQQLQNEFFKDLLQFRLPVIFLLDNFDEASAELQQWISDIFLMEVADNPRLYAVVAGQVVPEPSLEWESLHRKFHLFTITDPELWYQYAKERGYPLDLKELGILVDLFQGVPSLVGQALQTVTQNRQSS